MSWFGWMTKGRCEVSAADGFVASMEVIGAIVLMVFIYAVYLDLKSWQAKRRKVGKS